MLLVLSYGITKSGSTLAFELAKAALEHAGYPQPRLPDGVVEPGHHINFVNAVDETKINRLVEAIPADKMIVVKTHTGFAAPFLLNLNEYVEAGNLKVHTVYRDPREVCLSLMDAGRKAREKHRRAFSEIETLEHASKTVKRQVSTFLRWASITDALHLFYNDTAFDMEATVSRMATHLGIAVDAALVCKQVTEQAFTQQNKATRDRYKDELTVRQNEQLEDVFRAFIRNACLEKNEDWFARQRERWLRIAADEQASPSAASES